ncbi:hypothetical protein [Streptosporangium roseum]|uniref:hypothetical protein n=1 Tax=Streptosporangium roseum TaxID=2001 RepID=UPI0004CCF784|nr:hypothetical protein [Streptosporangium roseum]
MPLPGWVRPLIAGAVAVSLARTGTLTAVPIAVVALSAAALVGEMDCPATIWIGGAGVLFPSWPGAAMTLLIPVGRMVMPAPMVPCLTRKVMTFAAGSVLEPCELIDRVVPLMVPVPDWPMMSALASSDDRSHVVV